MKKWEEKLAIVILNYNSADQTISALKHIRTISNYVQIIVVDNHSSDDSRDKLKPYCECEQVIYIENEKNTGYAAGNNVAIRYALSKMPGIDTICIMNPDIMMDKADGYRELYNALWSQEKLASITALTIYNGMIRMPNDFGWKKLNRKHLMFSGTLLGRIVKESSRYSELILEKDKIAYADILQGCFFLIKKDVIKEIGLLDEHTFLYQEETILGKKVSNAGYKNAVLTTVYIQHNHRVKEKELIHRKNKLFDIKCFYESRKYYIKSYSDEPGWFKVLACMYLDLDHIIKRIIVRVRYKK